MLQHRLHASLQLLHHVDLPACAVDGFRRVVWWNDRAEQLFGVRREDVLHREWHTVVQTDEPEHSCAVCAARSALRRGQTAAVTSARFSVNGLPWAGLVIPLPTAMDQDALVSFLFVTSERLEREVRPAMRPAAASDEPPTIRLTPRERELLQCIVDGLDARGIAERLGVSHATARNYVQRLLAKLDVRSKAEAVRLAFTSNLLAAEQRS